MTGRTRVTDDGRIDDRVPDQVGRTHCAELWFAGDRVYKRKRPVALRFLDFSTLDARRSACDREVELDRRLAPAVYLGVVDVHDAAGDTVDVAVEMRLPDDRRLATLAAVGADADAYRPDVTAATYDELLRRAERLLGMGESRRPGRLVVGGRSPGDRRRRRGADAQRAVAAGLRRRP